MRTDSFITPVAEATIGQFTEISSGIKSEDLGFALNAVSKNLYSNPIGSFVREIVSNAVDANTENNSNKPVLVNIYKEEELWYFSVRDYGKGMSEEFFAGVYMNWFNSSKRESNILIGGWGIGSKSPLAYVDSYELETIHKKIKYSYYIYKTSAEPKATLISSEEIILLNEEPDCDGTLIKFEVKKDDLYKIYNECCNQLLYFNNVVVKHQEYYYKNDYNILDSDLFRYNTANKFLTELHICIGNVPYKIDFKLLNIPVIDIAMGLKFDIGELPVVLSRESINYEDDKIDVINLIKNKIKLFLEDINNRLENQKEYNTLEEYIKYIYNLESKTFYLKLGEYSIRIPKVVIYQKSILYNLKGLEIQLNKEEIKNVVKIITKSGVIGNNRKYYSYSLYDYCILKNSSYNKYSDLYHKNKNYVQILDFNIELAEKIAFVTGYADTQNKVAIYNENYLLICKAIYDGIKNSINSNRDSLYNYYPSSFKEELDEKNRIKKEKVNLISYNKTNNKVEIPYTKLNNYKHIFYLIKNDSINWEEVAHFEHLFNTFNSYFQKQLTFVVISQTVINSYKKDKRFRPAYDIFKYKKLFNHFARILITKEYKNISLTRYVYDISSYYYKLYNIVNRKYNIVLSEETSIFNKSTKIGNYSTDIYSFFYKYLINKGKPLNQYIYYNYIQELKQIKDIMDFTNIIKVSSISNQDGNKIIKHLIKTSKLTKLNRNYG